MKQQKFYTTKQIAEILGYSQSHVKNLICLGVLESIKLHPRAQVVTEQELKRIQKKGLPESYSNPYWQKSSYNKKNAKKNKTKK